MFRIYAPIFALWFLGASGNSVFAENAYKIHLFPVH
jgi:hypothetical protein